MSNVPMASRPASVRPPPPRPASVRPLPPRPAAAPADEIEELRTMDLTVVAAELAKSLPPPLPSTIPPAPPVPSIALEGSAPAADPVADDAAPIVSPFAPPSVLVRARAVALAAVAWTVVLGVFFAYVARAGWTWLRATGLPRLRALGVSARARASLEWARAKEHPSATRR